ncbi:hypothetical protein N2152v2_008033 [Parachlorella kessleri]
MSIWTVLWALALSWLAAAVWIGLHGLNIVNRWKHRHLPGPKPAWFAGNARRKNNLPDQLGEFGYSHLALRRWARQYGPAFVFYMGQQPVIVLNDPELIREAGVKNFKAFQDRPQPRVRTGPPVDMQFQNSGILSAKGKYWRGVRSACEPMFHTSALTSYAPAMNQAVDRLVEKLGPACGSGSGVNVNTALNGLTMDVIGLTAFGVDFRAQEADSDKPNPMLEATQVFFRPSLGFPPLLAILFFALPMFGELLGWVALKLRSKRLIDMCESRAYLWGASQQLLDNARHANQNDNGKAEASKTEEHALKALGARAAPGSVEDVQAKAFARGQQLYVGAEPPSSSSVVHMLRNAKNGDTGLPLRDVEICSQLFTFMLAGYETTSLSLSYTLYEIANRPALQERLQAEVAALGLPGRGSGITFEHLQRLPLCEATFSEALRMYPPASPLIAMTREAKEDAMVGGFLVPKGTQVMFNPFAAHFDPQQYTDPQEFRPDRFLPDNEENKKRHPYAFIPFGVGPRKCIGYKFAIEEGTLALARLVDEFEFGLDKEHHTGPLDLFMFANEEGTLALARLVDEFEFELDTEHHQGPLDLFMGITLNPKGGIWLKAAERGETLLRVPLRLALSDHPSDEDSNALVYQGAPWSVRLAAKLLRLRRTGATCPWHPYLQVLPERVPSPHTTFQWEDIQEIQYAPMLYDYNYAVWVANSAEQQLSPAATGGASAEELEWALSVVHSRSFGSPGEGGAAVRMLVPLVDFLNHAGDEFQLGGGAALLGSAAGDNVRWDLEAPAGEGGEWHMKVSATRDIEGGEELLLSYGERSNDSFFQHYGFIPPRNPHDDVTLFDNIEDAVQWLCDALVRQSPKPPASQAKQEAVAATVQAAQNYALPLGPQPAATSQQESEVMAREAARVKLLAGARLDGRLMAAFSELQKVLAQAGTTEAADSEGGSPAALAMFAESLAARQRQFHRLVATRCQEMLASMPTQLLQDLERLAGWEQEAGGTHGFDSMLQHYRTEIEAYSAGQGGSADSPFGGAADSSTEGLRSTPAADSVSSLSDAAASPCEHGPVVDAGLGSLSGEDEGLLGLLRQLATSTIEAAPADAEVNPEVNQAAAGGWAAEPAEQVPPQQRSMLPVIYRAYKKMILWDAILAAAVQE